MSFIWNVMLSFDNEEWWEDSEDQPRETCEPLERLNAGIPDGRLVSLIEPTYKDDAGYGMDANLYGGGFRRFDIEGFVKLVEAQDWKERSKVQLWVRGAEEGMAENVFTLIRLGRRSKSAVKAGATRKQQGPSVEAAPTKKRRAAGRKTAATR